MVPNNEFYSQFDDQDDNSSNANEQRAKKRRFVFGYNLCMIIFLSGIGYLINNYISKYVIVKELICIIIFIDFKRTKKRSHTKQTHGEMEKKDANKTKTETNISRALK